MATSKILSHRLIVSAMHASTAMHPIRAGPIDRKSHLPWNGKFNQSYLLLSGTVKNGKYVSRPSPSSSGSSMGSDRVQSTRVNIRLSLLIYIGTKVLGHLTKN